MNDFFSNLMLASLISIIVSLLLIIHAFFRKKRYRPRLIFAGVSLGIFLFAAIGYTTTLSPEQRAEIEQKQIAKQAQEAQEKAAKEEKKAQEAAEKKQKAEKEAAEKKQKEDHAAKAKEKATSAINQAVGDTIAEFKNPQNYPLVKDVSIKVDHDKKEVTMALVVNPATNKKAALDMADTLIRRYSSNVVIHDSSFTMPIKDSYGSLFDTYNISIGVAPAQYVDDRSKWLYDQYITAGMHTKQGPNWKNAR